MKKITLLICAFICVLSHSCTQNGATTYSNAKSAANQRKSINVLKCYGVPVDGDFWDVKREFAKKGVEYVGGIDFKYKDWSIYALEDSLSNKVIKITCSLFLEGRRARAERIADDYYEEILEDKGLTVAIPFEYNEKTDCKEAFLVLDPNAPADDWQYVTVKLEPHALGNILWISYVNRKNIGKSDKYYY